MRCRYDVTHQMLQRDNNWPRKQAPSRDYTPLDRLELWVEKSTMDDDLIPICRQLGVNLITSTGFQSVTGAIAMFSRAGAYAALGRPVRIFYLSDFDPAGDSMPVAVSRQIEFWHEQFGDGVDLKLTPLALTRAQVEQYGLPTIPIKDSDKRRDAFTDRHGVDGAVELDALEAIYPGELSRLIREAISAYRDEELEIELLDVASEADAIVSETWDHHIEHLQRAADDLDGRVAEVVERFIPKLKKLAEQFNAAMESLRSESEELQAVIEDATQYSDLHIVLPERPTAKVEPPDESSWLYSSTRTFGEQLERYRRHREGQ
jgi:hypothetical protein